MHASLITDETIVAIASPLAPARRGIVRVSGDLVVPILRQLGWLDPADQSTRARRFAALADLGDPLGTISVDVMLWPTRHSYTGQPSTEIHMIGSLPIMEAVLSRIVDAGARPARPGEFTMRAFLAGRLDLTQAEAVLGVIDAEDPESLDLALSQLAGNLSRPLQNARDTLLNLLADVEAGLDFVDEDIEFIEDADLVARLVDLRDLLSEASVQLRDRGDQKSYLSIVLRGLPNAGKSCLLNTLTRTDTAIVTDQAGTTRDVITVQVQYEGHSFSITDTAGIENRSDDDEDFDVMSQAQMQADDAVRKADVCLWCIDASDTESAHSIDALTMVSDNAKRSVTNLLIYTKTDLAAAPIETNANGACTAVSSVTGEGIEQLWNRLRAIAESRDAVETGGVIGTAARCRDSLRQAIVCLNNAIASTQNQAGHEWVAAEIRSAVDHLGEVTGAVYTDDILDRVFSRFCIGK
ncbi:tRNA uridine-5-carboxymethylaminomethyl(34) synthesis GTPase MnmE [Neorhodopirellula pilleata]|uniref:tRNA modification GTPase MnmE n=1 Tax=Neorhodopirellula pilleata TaxID=2714738 RepID=A0A5C6AL95_9BACT|nr:tRNA uridine-5-carboxymethylaminomethyl(34) synthesis GTPase MnmE [Neorhodopirellula pilleata]TWT98943.1 tRNA modification GTPase MnmE [Neorhodopirellula pilleata]